MMMGILLQQEGSKPNLEKAEHILNVQFLLSQIMLRRVIIMVRICIKWNVIMMLSSSSVLLVQH